MNSTQCPAGNECFNYTCVPPTPCQIDMQCPYPQICQNGLCKTPAYCLKNSECSSGQYCDISSMRCKNLISCTSDSNCYGDTPYCDTSKGFCKACYSNLQCSYGKYCNNGNCDYLPNSPNCTTDSQCPSYASHCVNKTCVSCSLDSHCLPHQRCYYSLCVNQEPYNYACQSNQECNYFNPYCDATSKTCAKCSSNTNCAYFGPNFLCKNQQCLSSCSSDAQCK